MNTLLSKIHKNIDMIKTGNDGRPSFYVISSTAKLSPGYNAYCTPNRFFNCFESAGCIVFTEKQAVEIASFVDGMVDYILIDAEKSVLSDIAMPESRVPMVKIIEGLVKKSKLCFFKPNDITADAIWHFSANILGSLINKKVAIAGAGNVGCKAALKFLESGCHVSMYRRSIEKAKYIAQALSMVNSLAYGTIKAGMNPAGICEGADIIIGATPGVPVIDIDCIKAASAHPLCIDTGKDSFRPSAIEYALSRNIEIYRTDITATLEGVISSILREELISKLHRGRKLIDGVPIVSGGVLGRSGDIIVDSLLKPCHIYGVADGRGDLKQSIDAKDNNYLSILMKHIEKDTYKQ